ncbi:tRNA uracil 4-sulfurtransferase ThiI [Pseudogracilibacillus sp. SE30717A]|uniref:tRNA uracil 4-sulfurtransferase ThiI n=1 Tax=Pseudogracilibacillus sp. SE30717A TaxID=3098293 RepID=UPI00300E1566
MNYDHILIRYGELGLKGKNIKQFILQLQKNIQQALIDFPKVRVTRSQGRMFIVLNGESPEPIIDKCKNVFGIYSMSLAIKVENNEEAIKEGALSALTQSKEAKTFKVSVRRANKRFLIRSQELNRILGAHLLKNSSDYTVDVHHPDVEVKVEIREKATYITSTVIRGAGGLPVGTGGKSLLLLSGGIDSPVAGYLMMKRGVKLEMIHFHSPPFTSERAKQKVLDLTKVLTEFGGTINIHLVPFTKLQQEIFKVIPERYAMTVMRRVMLQISERVCEKKKILAMSTGESLGQVASQTLASMNVINEVTNLPVLRPLVGFDKEEIINYSKRIGTYDISVRPYEDCCTIFVPKSPVTNPTREKVNYLEKDTDFSELIHEAVEKIQLIKVDNKPESQDNFDELL